MKPLCKAELLKAIDDLKTHATAQLKKPQQTLHTKGIFFIAPLGKNEVPEKQNRLCTKYRPGSPIGCGVE
jgi:hypothetical protein